MAHWGAIGLFAVTCVGCGIERETGPLEIIIQSSIIPADGFASTVAIVRTPGGEVVPAEFEIVDGRRVVRMEGARIRSTVNAGTATIEARYPGRKSARATITTTPVYSDHAADGTPDFLRLDDPADRQAFIESFTYLAELQFFRPLDQVPAEISDCSALIRYAYRETLREHDAGWAKSLRIHGSSTLAQPAKYFYPFTPLGANLFRAADGPFRESDLKSGVFTEFADAETLRKFNTHFISRDITRAQRGDLLFYRQANQRSPAHAMIFMAESQIDDSHDQHVLRVVYHTGPIGKEKGEIRSPAVRELIAHPQPQWRPLPGNSNFLGVYRWNILRQES
jgi:uncharacterized protein